MIRHLTAAELEAGLDAIRRSPGNDGVLALIVRRPRDGEREILEEGTLDLNTGLIGDNWSTHGSSRTPDGSAHPEKQITLMNSRVIDLLTGGREWWQLAGDQLFVDLDLSLANLPAGTRLTIGSTVIEVTPPPHTGCAKFVERFGRDAMMFVNSPLGRELNLRGINAKVVQAGVVRVRDRVRKIEDRR